MGRARRTVSDTGEVMCPVCKLPVHISKYRTRMVDEDTKMEDIWYEENGRLFGRPDGYCKACASKKTQGAVVMAKYLEDLEVERLERQEAYDTKVLEADQIIWDRIRAESPELFEPRQ